LSSGFFDAKKGETDSGSDAEVAGRGASKAAPRTGGGEAGEDTPSRVSGKDEDAKKDVSRDKDEGEKSDSATQARRYENEHIETVAEEERGKGRRFDWWFLIKILIVLLILFLLILIALSNLRRR
jgi:hypothetical protein